MTAVAERPVLRALAPRRRDGDGMPAWVGGTLGVVLLVALWEVLAVTVFNGALSGVPRPWSVVTTFWDDWGHGIYWHTVVQTLKEAATGFLVANVLAIVLGVAFVQIPFVETALLRIAIASYCLPIVAVGPILTFALNGDAPMCALAGILVFFPSLVGVVVGLRSADQLALDVVRATGGGIWTQLVKVRARAALPSLFAALQIAAPSAILGALIGEYLGGTQGVGLGFLMINSETSVNVPRTWGIAGLCTVMSGLFYLAFGIVGRLATPWAPKGRQRT